MAGNNGWGILPSRLVIGRSSLNREDSNPPPRIRNSGSVVLPSCPAQDKGYWRAASNTANSITGDISISDAKITINFTAFPLVQARSLAPAEVSAVFDADVNDGGTGTLYRVTVPGDEALSPPQHAMWRGRHKVGGDFRFRPHVAGCFIFRLGAARLHIRCAWQIDRSLRHIYLCSMSAGKSRQDVENKECVKRSVEPEHSVRLTVRRSLGPRLVRPFRNSRALIR